MYARLNQQHLPERPAAPGRASPALRMQRSIAAPEERVPQASPERERSDASLPGFDFGRIPVFPRASGGAAVVRRCSCGGHSANGGECAACRAARERRGRGMEGVLTKLEVGPPGDAFEREADAVADAVVAGWDAGGARHASSAGAGSGPATAARRVQRQMCSLPDAQLPLSAEDADEESRVSSEEPGQSVAPDEEAGPIRMQRSPGGAVPSAPAGPSLLAAAGSSGRPLPEGPRRDMETRMGADFGSVRIHTDRQAAEMSDSLGARAFAYGRDIFFNAGQFDPASGGGRHLLAHELTHTLQQNGHTLRRLAITGVGPLVSGPCGGYSRRWDFGLGAPAANAGYIVQQIDFYEYLVDCPRMGACTASPNLTFWEAWPVRAGASFHEMHSVGFTDQSSYGSKPNKVGYVAALGEVKYYERTVTGDLGTFNAAPATPAGGWSPNASGQSGSLPSTLTRPSWWSTAPTEGPEKRSATASWRCCGKSDDFNDIKATP
jgi:hypothetical protein